ncbi:hypothetical protein [Nocardiopsis coralliicola]
MQALPGEEGITMQDIYDTRDTSDDGQDASRALQEALERRD